jgi:hypothetical protein
MLLEPVPPQTVGPNRPMRRANVVRAPTTDLMRRTRTHSPGSARRHDERADSRTQTQLIHVHAHNAHRPDNTLRAKHAAEWAPMRVDRKTHSQHQCTRQRPTEAQIQLARSRGHRSPLGRPSATPAHARLATTLTVPYPSASPPAALINHTCISARRPNQAHLHLRPPPGSWQPPGPAPSVPKAAAHHAMNCSRARGSATATAWSATTIPLSFQTIISQIPERPHRQILNTLPP